MHNPPVPLSRFQKRLAVVAVSLAAIEALMIATANGWFDFGPMPVACREFFEPYLYFSAGSVGGLSTYFLASHSGRTRLYSALLGILVLLLSPLAVVVIPSLALEIRKRSQGLQTAA